MSDELLYTSAPRGLRPGRQGFCTVAATQGLTESWIDALEGLTGYRPAFGPTDPRNPVNFAHLRIAIGGRERSVLARVAAAGLDYSGRSNKFAHFLLPDDGERPAAGPARMLACADLRSAWDGRVQWLPPRQMSQPADRPPRPCMLWGKAAGDAGWGGVLAESALAGRPANIVVPFGVDVLALFDEALRLLPSAQRWRVTFATYSTGLPPGVACNWRGVLAGSPEAAAAAAAGLVIDLTEPRSAPATPAADAGRKGRSILGQLAVPSRSSSAGAVVIGEPEMCLEGHMPFAFSAPPRRRRARTFWMALGCLGLTIGVGGMVAVACSIWYLRTGDFTTKVEGKLDRKVDGPKDEEIAKVNEGKNAGDDGKGKSEAVRNAKVNEMTASGQGADARADKSRPTKAKAEKIPKRDDRPGNSTRPKSNKKATETPVVEGSGKPATEPKASGKTEPDSTRPRECIITAVRSPRVSGLFQEWLIEECSPPLEKGRKLEPIRKGGISTIIKADIEIRDPRNREPFIVHFSEMKLESKSIKCSVKYNEKENGFLLSIERTDNSPINYGYSIKELNLKYVDPSESVTSFIYPKP